MAGWSRSCSQAFPGCCDGSSNQAPQHGLAGAKEHRQPGEHEGVVAEAGGGEEARQRWPDTADPIDVHPRGWKRKARSHYRGVKDDRKRRDVPGQALARDREPSDQGRKQVDCHRRDRRLVGRGEEADEIRGQTRGGEIEEAHGYRQVPSGQKAESDLQRAQVAAPKQHPGALLAPRGVDCEECEQPEAHGLLDAADAHPAILHPVRHVAKKRTVVSPIQADWSVQAASLGSLRGPRFQRHQISAITAAPCRRKKAVISPRVSPSVRSTRYWWNAAETTKTAATAGRGRRTRRRGKTRFR